MQKQIWCHVESANESMHTIPKQIWYHVESANESNMHTIPKQIWYHVESIKSMHTIPKQIWYHVESANESMFSMHAPKQYDMTEILPMKAGRTRFKNGRHLFSQPILKQNYFNGKCYCHLIKHLEVSIFEKFELYSNFCF
jgi:hypothetical protein